MTVNQLSTALSLNEVCVTRPEREVTSVYIGDLLSWVMGRAPADCAWITIMSNINVCAVASLAGVACIIMAEGVLPDPPALDAAQKHGVNIYSSDKTAYELATELAALKL
jgi:hypothetical protein